MTGFGSSWLYPFSAVPTAGVPTGTMIAPAEAWILVLALLALSCVALWFLTRSFNASSHGASRSRPHGRLAPAAKTTKLYRLPPRRLQPLSRRRRVASS